MDEWKEIAKTGKSGLRGALGDHQRDARRRKQIGEKTKKQRQSGVHDWAQPALGFRGITFGP